MHPRIEGRRLVGRVRRPDDLAELRHLLTSTVTFTDGVEQRHRVPADGSPAHLDEQAVRFAGEWDSEPLRTCAAVAGLTYLNGQDALTALTRVLAPPPLLFADLHLLRVIIESAARASWFYAEGIDSEERLRRGWTERLWSLNEMRLLGQGVDGFVEGGGVDRIRQGCAALGLPFTPVDGHRAAFVVKRPSTTDLAADLWPHERMGRLMFKYTSSVLHSTVGGLMSRLDHGPVEGMDPHTMYVAPAARTVGEVWRMTAVGLTAYLHVSRLRLAYFGWLDASFVQWHRHVRSKLQPYLATDAGG